MSVTELSRLARRFWDRNPLLAFELSKPGTIEFLAEFDRIRSDLEQYALHLWEFDGHSGERVLDVGCGAPVFLLRRYARGGARIVGVDLSGVSLSAARDHLRLQGMAGHLCQGSANDLPFRDQSFDFVASSGVLHHTPNVVGAIEEVHRVLRRGGRAVVSLYFRSLFLRPAIWPATRLALSLLLRPVPGRASFQDTPTADDFVRRWDGNDNPVGRCYSHAEVRELFSRFRVEKIETHVFHHRFFRINTRAVARVMDILAPTMIYVVVRRHD